MMRFAALLERTPSGWRAWVPAVPGVEAEASTSSGAEADLAQALERHVRTRWANDGLEGIPEIRCFTIEIRSRRDVEVRRPLDRQSVEERRRTMRRLDAVIADGARIPPFLLDAVFAYRREVLDSLPEEPPHEEAAGEAEYEPGGNVVLFVPREG